jgi:LPS export ABC transporter protein LptC
VYLVQARSSIGDRLGDGSFVVVLSGPHVTFFDKDGKTLVGDAPKAVVTERNKTILMSGGVTARTQDGAVLTCDTMAYDGNTERVHGQGDVVLTSARGDRLSGDELDGDVRLNHVTVSAVR